MKILLIIEPSGGGTGRHVVDLANALVENGHEVHLIYSSTRADDNFLNEIDNPRLHTFDVPMKRQPHPADLFALLNIRKYIRKHGAFDIIHGHSSKAGALARLLKVTGVGKAKSVYTPHAVRTLDPTLSAAGRIAWRTIERFLGRWFTDAVIAVSPDEHEHIVESAIVREDRAHLVINGLATAPADNRAAVRQRFGIADDEICLGYVGRFAHQKAPEVLVNAFADVAADCPKLKLLMLGFGEQESMVRELITAHGLEDRIVVRTNESGFECMCAFDVFVMPSRYEGMPYVLLEAAGAGLPIIATDVGGVSAVVHHNQNGLIVAIDDQADLAAAIRTVAIEPETRQRMAKISSEHSNDFNADRMTMETVDVYEASHGRQKVVTSSATPVKSDDVRSSGQQPTAAFQSTSKAGAK